ncbi:dihydrolipoamide acetyltransferase family protein [Marininema halotolerans]|uniref:Dihydrolipoamide acetyltransferase component of pyruvate dehydrogenase complex n=1 Tax=Marininema halotolerans TaxID=1155944 RepID=A0A1I6TTV8_9BACL|nr:dihydrolipoamide acetyltransferase family protein [Marininema halotolerans]SFS92600.1 2-oxoisovalerate dehydrogenase E2 component (dihydrolipoyl transacylase) [Marininema halotolerans]
MATDITMPQLGESVTEGTITKWLKAPGDSVDKYEPLCEVATDKVNAEVPAVMSGTMTEIVTEEGVTVAVGEIICRIDDAQGKGGEGASSAKKEEPAYDHAGTTARSDSAASHTETNSDSSMKRRYSPAVLQLAEKHHIDLEQVDGSGRGGRITRKDIQKVIESGGTSQRQPSTTPEVPSMKQDETKEATPTFNQKESTPVQTSTPSHGLEPGDTEVPLSSVRKTIAQRMVQSKHEAPHAWTMVQADVSGLVKLREKLKGDFKKQEGISLTYMPFFIKAVVDTLKEFPKVNAVWGGDKIILKKRINISIAVATDEALYVPVIKDADEKSILGIAKAVHHLAEKTRAGKLTMDDLAGGTFTVNNTGSFGSIASQPIINQPQAAIISMESIVKQPVIKDDMIAIRDLVNLCLSLDHRILDGLMAGRFLARVKERLEAYTPESTI